MKKRIGSGELGSQFHIETYVFPAEGASALGTSLERAIRRDWLAGAASEVEKPPRLIAMDGDHRS